MGDDGLVAWLDEEYQRSFCTAALVLAGQSDPEMIVRESYLRAWRFRASLGQGPAMRPWLYRIVVSACVAGLRTSPSGSMPPIGPPFGEVTSTATGEGSGGRRRHDGWRSLAGATAALPLSLRAPLVLHYFTGLSEREVAIAIGRRPATVRSRLHEGRSRLAAPDDVGVVDGAGRPAAAMVSPQPAIHEVAR